MEETVSIALRRFHLSSLGKFGCLLGIAAAFLPGILCGFLGLALARALQSWAEGWQDFTISLLGSEVVRLDLVELLNLEGILKLLTIIASASGSVLFLTVLAVATTAGLLAAIMAIMLGLVYNLVASATGGMIVDLSTVPRPAAGKQVNDEPGVGSRD